MNKCTDCKWMDRSSNVDEFTRCLRPSARTGVPVNRCVDLERMPFSVCGFFGWKFEPRNDSDGVKA